MNAAERFLYLIKAREILVNLPVSHWSAREMVIKSEATVISRTNEFACEETLEETLLRAPVLCYFYIEFLYLIKYDILYKGKIGRWKLSDKIWLKFG